MQVMSTAPVLNGNLIRSGLKSISLGVALAEVAASFNIEYLRVGGARAMTVRERACWLQDAAQTVLQRIGIAVVAQGDPLRQGLLVSNLLSYLDVLAYASTMPCTFVAKREVRGWPVFGKFATMAGTIYVDRERHAGNGGAAALMEEALAAGVTVVLFPEGTSSDGREVLRFHSGLFEPAIRADAAVTAAAIGYSSCTAGEARIAYHGEDVFGTHLVRTLGQSKLEARVAFATARRYADRKEAARATQAEIERLRGEVAGRPAIETAAELRPLTHAR
jgi:1-acyl-sn-glycerol-3-phosphate acyltransferase